VAWLFVDQNGGSVANSRLPRTAAGRKRPEIRFTPDNGGASFRFNFPAVVCQVAAA